MTPPRPLPRSPGHPRIKSGDGGAVEPLDQRRRLAAAREAGVKPREVGQRHAEPAETDGEADQRILRQRDFGAGAVQAGEEGRRADVGQELDRRKIERHLQRLARRDRALVAEIEILRRIGAVAHRPVEQHCLRVGEALLERERIDEGLQRRARRAGGAGHVDRAIAGGVVVIRRADAGANFSARVVDDHHRRRQFRPQPRDALLDERLEPRLQPRVDGEPDDPGLLVGGDRFFGGMRGERRKGQARSRDRLAFSRRGVVGANRAALGEAIKHAVARGARRLRRAIRPPRFRRLRQGDQQRRFGEGELQRLLAEIGERGRPHPFEIAAEGSEREVSVERALFADLALDLESARDLPELGRERPLRPRLDEPRDLHGERRAAADHAAFDEPLRACADERADVDAVVLIEPPVLIGDEHREIARIDVVRGRGQAPAPVRQCEGPQQSAVAIDDDRRALARGHKIDRPEARRISRPGDARRNACDEEERKRRKGEEDGAIHAYPVA